MSFLKTLDISASGLTAQRMRMDIVSENLANASTTRTASGGPYRRRVAVLSEKKGNPFSWHLENASHTATNTLKKASSQAGVKVSGIYEDPSDFKIIHDPDHPDADEDGYVRMPNVEELKEILDMMSATRSYEANITAFNATKGMAMKALEIGR